MNAVTHSLDQLIQASLKNAYAQRTRLTALHIRYTIASVVLSAMATFFAGISSLTDRPIVAEDWRVTCAIAAALTMVATVVGGVQSLLVRPDQLTLASECIGKLRALLADATAPAPNFEEVRRKYQQLLIDYAGIEI
jgi:hypothetical protein